MRRFIPLLAALVLAAATAAVSAREGRALPKLQEPVLTQRVDGKLLVATDGSVRDYVVKPSRGLPADLAQKLRTAVRGWRFEPVVIDGKAVNAETTMRVTLTATEVDEDHYRIEVDNVTFPMRDAKQEGSTDTHSGRASIEVVERKALAYPRRALEQGATGSVVVFIRLNADGTVAETLPRQAAVFNRADSAITQARLVDSLARNAAEGIARWRFKVTSKVPGEQLTPEELTVAINVDYTLGGGYVEGSGWRLERRTVPVEAHWLPDLTRTARVGVSDTAPGETIPLDSPFKLLTEARGALL